MGFPSQSLSCWRIGIAAIYGKIFEGFPGMQEFVNFSEYILWSATMSQSKVSWEMQ
jgi:hypothetical protein